MEIIQPVLHYSGHWLAPFLIAFVVWRSDWVRAGFVIAAANLIDLDHLLATPIFDQQHGAIQYCRFPSVEQVKAYTAPLRIKDRR
ncbi:MAG: DUF6122 family protein, partial [Pseudomonadota bacterium]|nr:DUF6122 family protein [Pseudomonadota bacterium]